MSKELEKIKNYIKKIKHKEFIAIGVLCVVLIAMYFISIKVPEKSADAIASQSQIGYCESMATDILDAVKLMSNSEQCKVIINWDGGVESVIAYTTSSASNSSTKSPEIINNNGTSSPIVLKEEFPHATSVAIVCPSSVDVATKLKIRYMVSTLLDIDINNIAIYSC